MREFKIAQVYQKDSEGEHCEELSCLERLYVTPTHALTVDIAVVGSLENADPTLVTVSRLTRLT